MDTAAEVTRQHYPPHQLLAIYCECQRNIENANRNMSLTNYDVAAAELEVAAHKLRVIQRQVVEEELQKTLEQFGTTLATGSKNSRK